MKGEIRVEKKKNNGKNVKIKPEFKKKHSGSKPSYTLIVNWKGL